MLPLLIRRKKSRRHRIKLLARFTKWKVKLTPLPLRDAGEAETKGADYCSHRDRKCLVCSRLISRHTCHWNSMGHSHWCRLPCCPYCRRRCPTAAPLIISVRRLHRLAIRDFDLMTGYEKCSFGTTLVFWNQYLADHWEPDASPVDERIETIFLANSLGIQTWVSLEPVIDPTQAMRLIEVINPLVDHWKIGKINHMPYIELQINWRSWRDDRLIPTLNLYNADYYLKNSLSEL
ncbi:MAG: hypothetical protein GY845_07165 [Planctomycetes bacterium]|nr:hypothetical protein [Planctomycetota bacterium]